MIPCLLASLIIFLSDNYIKGKADEGKELSFFKSKAGKILEQRNFRNKGACMGFLEKYPNVLKAVTVVMMILLVTWYALVLGKNGRTALKAGLALLTGGAAGNLYDRLKRGYVVDWFGFKIPLKKIRRICFNLSDMALFAGVLLVAADALAKSGD